MGTKHISEEYRRYQPDYPNNMELTELILNSETRSKAYAKYILPNIIEEDV